MAVPDDRDQHHVARPVQPADRLPDDSPQVGVRIGDITFPGDVVLVAIIRDGHARPPDVDGTLEAGDELLFVTAQSFEKELAEMLAPRRGNVAVSVTATTTRFNR